MRLLKESNESSFDSYSRQEQWSYPILPFGIITCTFFYRLPFSKCKYRKIPKISPGAYIFQRPFLRGLFLEGLIFGGAYLRREICVSKPIGLAYSWKQICRFCFVFPSTSPRGAYIWRGDFTVVFFFLHYRFGGIIFVGAYTWKGLFS